MDFFENKTEAERAVLVSVDTGEFDVESSLAELTELAKTAGAEVICEMTQKREAPEPGTYLGRGKLEELSDFCENEKPDLVIIDGELSPAQQKNIETITDVRVIDRTTLILDIFAQRALSGEGKLQVELAQLKYALPRLGGKGASMSRLGGGIGTRGPGETKLETDRRHIRRRISALTEDLKALDERRTRYRERRKKDGVITVALVGYTNAGKSTLINNLTNATNENKITTSSIPNTTIDFIKTKLDNISIIDSPGFTNTTTIYNPEEFELIKRVMPRTFLKPATYQVKPISSILIEDKIRLQSSINNSLTFYISNAINVERVFDNNTNLLDLEQITLDIPDNSDLIIKSLGFINIKKAC